MKKNNKHIDEITMMKFIDNELSENEVKNIELHLKTCKECSEQKAFLEKEEQIISDAMLDINLKSDILQNVMNEIEKKELIPEKKIVKYKKNKYVQFIKIASIASIIFVLGLISFYNYSNVSKQVQLTKDLNKDNIALLPPEIFSAKKTEEKLDLTETEKVNGTTIKVGKINSDKKNTGKKRIIENKKTNMILSKKPHKQLPRIKNSLKSNSSKKLISNYSKPKSDVRLTYGVNNRDYGVPNKEILQDEFSGDLPKELRRNVENKKRKTIAKFEKEKYRECDKVVKAMTTISKYNQNYYSGEKYSNLIENNYNDVSEKPISTFSIDVDAASYSNMRRFLYDGVLPPENSIRIEELINYFNYNYEQPENNKPFSIITEINKCPWNKNNLLLHIGLQGKKIDKRELPASNLVFLLDVSGSMNSAKKLPLLKSAMRLLVNELREQDRVAIVVYAGASGLVLPSTSGNNKAEILNAINRLRSGGSTAGASGIKLAYKIAQKNFIKGANNRIILATDGDFNVGISRTSELVKLIEVKRQTGIFLTVLGFGTGNLQDEKMENLADKGNGNYAYIDSLIEAKKVFVNELGATLHTIAKDVKLQLEFNPEYVKSYRLIGYENRKLNRKDFNDDTKDAGEMGSGHTVTALYEIVPKDGKSSDYSLKYQKNAIVSKRKYKNEYLTVKFRYKTPEGKKSKLIIKTVNYNINSEKEESNNFIFSSAVAELGLILRNSKYKENANFKSVIERATYSKGTDNNGLRAEFITLSKIAENLFKKQQIIKSKILK